MMSGEQIGIGSVVELVSGGPKMTVRGRYHDGSTAVVHCVWFVWTGDDTAASVRGD